MHKKTSKGNINLNVFLLPFEISNVKFISHWKLTAIKQVNFVQFRNTDMNIYSKNLEWNNYKSES